MNHEVKLLNSIIDTKDYVTAVNGGVENVFIEESLIPSLARSSSSI